MPDNEDREFQIELLRIQLKYDNVNLVATVFLSLVVSLVAVLATIMFSGVFPASVGSLLTVVLEIMIIITVMVSIVIALISKMLQNLDLDKLKRNYVSKPKTEKKDKPVKASKP